MCVLDVREVVVKFTQVVVVFVVPVVQGREDATAGKLRQILRDREREKKKESERERRDYSTYKKKNCIT